MRFLDPSIRFRVSLPEFSILTRILALSLLLCATPAWEAQAQDSSGKRPLEIADYRLWKTISGEEISPDGRWVAWSYGMERGDEVLHVKSLDSGAEHIVALGSNPQFSDDGRWVAYSLSPTFAEAARARAANDPVVRSAGLLNLASAEIVSWDGVDSFGFAKSSSHLFVKKTPSNEDADHDGTDLILRNLGRGYDEFIGSIDGFAFNKPGSHFAYTVDAADKDGNGLYLIDLATGARTVLDNSRMRYSRLTWSEEGNALAALKGETPDGDTERANDLVAFTGIGEGAVHDFVIASSSLAGIPEGSVVSEKAGLSWSEDLTKVFVGTKPQDEELEDWPEGVLPLADVNIWHWADEQIQTAQIVSARRNRNRTFMSAVNLEDSRLVPLADDGMRTVDLTRNGEWGIGRDDRNYISDWEPSYADYYRVNTATGERTLILERQLRTMGLSPSSEYFLYWKDGDIWVYEITNDTHRNLTDSAPVDFTDQEFDNFGERPSYGVAGWTKDEDNIVLNHRYDLWLQPLDGDPATNLTEGRGASDEVRFRYVRTDSEERFIDLSERVLISAYGEWTKKEGFFELRGDRLRELTWEDRKFGRPQKAEETDRYLYTVETFGDFPDLWVSDWDFTDRNRVTEANPQQDEFLWGHRVLFDYTNDDGVPLQGTLAIPEGYEEGQRLPMIVRFYEDYSQNMHVYAPPHYRHQPNFSGYVSRGYLLMQPDIHFRVGSSHSDMLECIEAATRKVIELGYADPDAIGLSGHSYSGGGGAYIATRSDMFAAVAHGAAPINLVSEFNQLFVGSGDNNHQYDTYGQGRYGTNPYDDFQLYWDQSPISGVENMDTPVLYLHGEADGSVNWEQGLEWYNALRFLGKPIIWLSYPGEGHGLGRLENKIDFQYRLRDFFDHHLKGLPAPSWMTEGVPFLDKGEALREYAPRVFPNPADTIRGGE